MGLADRLDEAAAAPPPRPHAGCSVGHILTGLPDGEADSLRRALDGRLTASAIARILTDEGHPVGGTTVNRHRRGDCKCIAVGLV